MFNLLKTITFISLFSTASAIDCGKECSKFSYEKGELGICSKKNSAEIWNITSGECIISMNSSLDIVSYTSVILSFGAVFAVRRQIGANCWDNTPTDVALSVITNTDKFEEHAFCENHPYHSPSIGWEVRYKMRVNGYNDCASIIIIHEDAISECYRLHADGRGWATIGYLIAVFVGLLCMCIIPTFYLD